MGKSQAIQDAKSLYASAWQDFCRTYWDDERAVAESHMRIIRQRLMDGHGVDLDKHFLSALKGYGNYCKALGNHSRFKHE